MSQLNNISDPVPACDYFVELRVGKERLTLPAGRLWSFSVNRCGNELIIISRYRSDQRGFHKYLLPDGL